MKIYDTIIANGAVICYNILASKISKFKSGGAINLLIEPTSIDGLVKTLELLGSESYSVIGNGSNVLIDDNGFKSTIISTRRVNGYNIDNTIITANCGELLTTVAAAARKCGLTGMEEIALIPGTIGGAIYMNAGAYRHNISDIIMSVTAYRKGVGVVKMSSQESMFAYRESLYSNNNDYVILSAELNLDYKNKVLITMRMQELAAKRKSSQPNLPSLGSVFRKVGDKSAGYYIEQAGLKGLIVGGAMISDLHANFIVNIGGATSHDYKRLVNIAEQAVKDKFDIELTREVIYL